MSTPLEFFEYKKGILSTGGVSLDHVADHVGTPCYVYSAEGFLKPLQELKKGLKGLDSLICFAAKSCSNIAILDLVAKAGAGVDLVSGGELFRAGLAGVSPQKIVFSGVGKTPGEMATALEFGEAGIFAFNVESVSELATLSTIAEELGRTATVALRFNPDVNAKTHPAVSTGLKKHKFGMSRAEILKIAEGIESFPGIALAGISLHIGSQLLSLAPLKDAFILTRELIEELDTILPDLIRFVDLGGGLGITYSKEKPPTIAQYCALIAKQFGPKSPLKRRLKILIEPGRLISGNAGVLLTEVLYRKVRKDKDFLVVDAAMNDLLRPALYGSHHEAVPVFAMPKGPRKKTDIVGPVCETSDCFAAERPLPKALNQGDLVAILSAGAYGFSMSGNYNSRPRAPEVLIREGKIRVIRDRESYEDLVKGERLE
ncbi:diaminopimelate decarboxylase [Bdellovibrionota bacterium FG-1]